MEPDRRTYLGLLAGALAGTAGCLGGEGETPTGEPTDGPRGASATDVPTETPRETPTPTATDGSTETAGGATTASPALVLDTVEPSGDVPLAVYPTKLATLLRAAAATEGPVRERADAFVHAPEPLLPGFDAVEIVDPTGGASGTYEVSAEGGPYHEMTLRAEEVPAEAADDPTPVSAVPEAYREFVVGALTDSDGNRQVEPQTERGEWVREHFFGEYVAYEGQTYRGRAVHPTDAVFFSTEVWYVLSLSSVDDAEDPVTLRLPEIDPAVRDTVDGALHEWRKTAQAPALAGPPFADAVREFAADTERVLTHTHAYDPSVRPRDERGSG